MKHYSNEQLFDEVDSELENERRSSRRILVLLAEIRSRRLYAERGFTSMFEMLVKRFKLSETSANERLKALDLMASVPAVEDGLVQGHLNLTNLALAQAHIIREEKQTGRTVTRAQKARVVQCIANKTKAQAEVELLKALPDSGCQVKRTAQRRVSATETRLCLNFPNEVLAKLKRLQEIWAHVDRHLDEVQIIDRALELALDRVDPLRKAEARRKKAQRATAPVKQRGAGAGAGGRAEDGRAEGGRAEDAASGSQELRENQRRQEVEPADKSPDRSVPQRPTYYSVHTDDVLWARSGGRCEFVDPQSGRRCECRFGLQREHIIPFAMGGGHSLENLMLLCRTHNDLMARRWFGDEKIDREIRSKK